MIKISVVAPVLNEVEFIGHSIMAAMPYVHSFHYGIDSKSSDGTKELVNHIVQEKDPDGKVFWYNGPEFDIDPMDMKQYNGAFNALIECAVRKGADAVWFLHPDMIVTEAPKEGIPAHAMAWWTHMTSYAGDLRTVISKGRCDKWKNIHATKMGVCYYGGYGSQNEDFYHSDITGKSYKHYGSEFSKYPFRVADSGIKISHFCELKDYRRRLEKMKLCLKTLSPNSSDKRIDEMASQHPRVTLEPSSSQFGAFEFTKSEEPIPDVFQKYGEEFKLFNKKEAVYGERLSVTS